MNDIKFIVSFDRAKRHGGTLAYLEGALDEWLSAAGKAHRSVMSIADMDVLMSIERIPTVRNAMIAIRQIEQSLEEISRIYSAKPELIARIDLTLVSVRDLKVQTVNKGTALLDLAEFPFNR